MNVLSVLNEAWDWMSVRIAHNWRAVTLIALVGLLGVVLLGYVYRWEWVGVYPPPTPQVAPLAPAVTLRLPLGVPISDTLVLSTSGGFSATTARSDDQVVISLNMPPAPADEHGPRTLWDWLQLLIIPLALALAGFIINAAEGKRNREQAERAHHEAQVLAKQTDEAARALAADNQRAEALQEYLSHITELLTQQMDAALKHSIIRARTAAMLKQLDRGVIDRDRRQQVIDFIREASILPSAANAAYPTDLNLAGLNLTGANLEGNDLQKADLSGASLRGASLQRAFLAGITLHNADLTGAKLQGASMREADLRNARLNHASLQRASLPDADLAGASLAGAHLQEALLARTNLENAQLIAADLNNAQLNGASLRGALLVGADMQDANLRNAVIERAQLRQTKSLKGAILPNEHHNLGETLDEDAGEWAGYGDGVMG